MQRVKCCTSQNDCSSLLRPKYLIYNVVSVHNGPLRYPATEKPGIAVKAMPGFHAVGLEGASALDDKGTEGAHEPE